MLSAIFVGFAFALGHHFFYKSLAGTKVPDQGWPYRGSRLSYQQVNIAAGSTLAFLVKACLVLAVSMAYYQVFWRAAKAGRDSPLLTVAQMDASYSGLSNLLAFKTISFWVRRPAMLSVAVIAWLLPIVPIVTPATLNVLRLPVTPTPSTEMVVPMLDFRSLAFSATIAGTSTSNGSIVYDYNGPSLAVQQVTGAAVLQGSILPIHAPSANSSWNVDFPGPALQCSNLTGNAKALIESNIAEHTFSSDNCFTPPLYLSWFQADKSLPFPSNASVGASAAPKLYFALLPSLIQPSVKAPWNPAACEYMSLLPNTGNWTSPIVPTGLDDTTIVECTLVEATYDMAFRYENGAQLISAPPGSTTLRTLNITRNFGSIASIGPEALSQLSYQSILYAFNSWILGSIDSGLSHQQPLILNSSVLNTVLLRAPEMSFLRPQSVDRTMRSVYHTDLLQVLSTSNNSVFRTSAPSQEGSIGQSLAVTIEELFHNITISLMSNQQLLPDASLNVNPRYIEVSFDTYQNTYIYSVAKLWITYGLALGLTAIVVYIGLASVYFSEASYGNNFSTIMRTSRAAELSVEASEESGHGANPLPKLLAKATISFHDRGAQKPDDETVASLTSELKPGMSANTALLSDDEAGEPRQQTTETIGSLAEMSISGNSSAAGTEEDANRA
ncbi:hypothetical protein LTR86_000841 [Recurvomyces mirabilis]|nr:hypothetical protein LTR86_000841 [Recurvomyces mirabilis]